MSQTAIEMELRQREAMTRISPHVQAAYQWLADASALSWARVSRYASIQLVIWDAQPRYPLLAPPTTVRTGDVDGMDAD